VTKELTDRQREVLDAIRRYVAEKGFPPSIRELGHMVGIKSLRGVTIHLDALERKGWIERERTSRGIRLSRQKEAIAVPLLETSTGLESPESSLSSDECVYVPPDIATTCDDLFALRVRGNCMTDECIADGDYVVVKRTKQIDEDSIVAIQLGSETVVKRLHKSTTHSPSPSSNSSHTEVAFAPDDGQVLGKVVCLFRRVT
jgi:repressor LexA